MTDPIARARLAYDRRQWGQACAELAAADREERLDAAGLERLAVTAYLTGQDDESADAWARAHHAFLQAGDVCRAVRCAFWLAHGLFGRGEHARGGAWIARARRLLDDRPGDCVEHGYLLVPDAIAQLESGDPDGATATLRQVAEIGERFRDPDLVALARHGSGRALIRRGEVREGVRQLDAAMVAIEAGDVSPVVVGEVYCSVISGCLEIFDVRRAQEWTAALDRWCEAQPELVLYRSQCLVRRAQIMQLFGGWPEAAQAADTACAQCLQGFEPSAAGAAFYQRAELHRLHGDFDAAEEAYREASRRGRAPQPGLALLRLAQGQLEAATAAIGTAVDAAGEARSRLRLLPASVEIMLAAGDVAAARRAAEELGRMAADLEAPFLAAVTEGATGAVLLAEGDARAALPALRRAWSVWHELEAPYEAARVRVLIGLAGRALGDEDLAAMELDAARWAFEHLGARPDLDRVDRLTRKREPRAPGGLTAREVEVLRLVAAGKTNRAIAAELAISEKTVARHLSNIFTKLDLGSRAAATAYAFRHGLVHPAT